MPLVNVAVFAMLSRSGILNIGQINVPYPVYALLGMAFWQLFSTGLITTGSSLTAAGDMITRINFSKKSLVIASMGRPILSFLIQWVLIVILFAFYRVLPNTAILLVPLVAIPIVLLTLGIGFIVSLLNAIVRDTGNLLTVSMTLLMYVTPVLYAKPQFGILKAITKYNPMYYMLSAGRDLVLYGAIKEQNGFLVSVSVSLMIFLLSLVLFHLTETRIAERI